jgi:hypothetical protein
MGDGQCSRKYCLLEEKKDHESCRNVCRRNKLAFRIKGRTISFLNTSSASAHNFNASYVLMHSVRSAVHFALSISVGLLSVLLKVREISVDAKR